jgi:hypothetical protein
MSKSRSRATLVDYLVAAIEPALIMLMVGSLMFFLLDMWYEGEFLDRLRWILFWFVLGIVMITRVSMQIGSALAKAYGLMLGGSVALVASTLAGFQPVLLVILGIVWWATHKLTFDCTLLDEDQDAGVGLLQESGIDPSALSDEEPGLIDLDPDEMDTTLLSEKSAKAKSVHSSDAARRPNAPGVWLIYFTLASLPIFGLGQWFVPAIEEDRRSGLLIYFLVYISSGMGLLLATSFLNLRRYLRQRKLKMPAAMSATWLSSGAIIVVALTFVAAALPLPGSGWSTMKGSSHESSELRASQNAVLNDGGEKGQGAGGEKNDPNAEQQTAGKGKEGGKSGPGNAKRGAPRGKQSKSGAAGNEGPKRQDESSDQKGQGERSPDQKNDQSDPSDSQEKGDQPDSQKEESGNQATRRPPPLPSIPFQAPSWLRGIFMIVGAIAVIFGLIRYGPLLLDALQAILASLFGGFSSAKTKKEAKDAEASSSQPAEPSRPFAAFADPFASGLSGNLSPNELVLYSFEALEAWANDRGLSRLPHETPVEFVRRVGEIRADVRSDIARLAGYFVTVVYGQRGLGAEVEPSLRQLWRALQGQSA